AVPLANLLLPIRTGVDTRAWDWRRGDTKAKGAPMVTIESPTMSTITPEVVEQHGLSPEEYERVLHALGREPNLGELGIFSVMWSEHCSYKSSCIHLKKLPTEAPWVICGPGEN